MGQGWTGRLGIASVVGLALLAQLVAVAAQEPAANKRSPYRIRDCDALEKRADPKYRYLLCSVGLYDRQIRGYLLTFDGVVARLPVAEYKDRGFRSETGPVPKPYESAIKADGNVVVWSDQDGPILVVRRTAEAKRTVVSTFLISPKLLDVNGLSIGAKPEDAWAKSFRKSCRVGRSLILKRGREGIMTCPVRFVRTNLRRQNLYHAGDPATSGAIELIEITHSELKQ